MALQLPALHSKCCPTLSRRAALRPVQRPQACIAAPSFSGLRASSSLHSLGTAEAHSSRPQHSLLDLVQNGSQWFAMRHGKRIPKLGRPADQRKHLLRALTTEILRHGKIKTTVVKAKAMRKHVDKMVVLAKEGGEHSRRQVQAFLYSKDLVTSLFSEAPDRYAERSSGFTRIITEPRVRRGDSAPMCVIEMV